MASRDGIFGNGSSFDQRYIPDYTRLTETVAALKRVGQTIVLTMGSFDLLHEGHYTYLERASQHGSILVVGVDSDEKIRARKGPNRPLVPQAERLGQLTHTRYVDMLTLKDRDDPKWHLIKAVNPDILIATEETYTTNEITELESGYVGRVVVLPYMETVSTTSKIRELTLRFSETLAPALLAAMMDHLGKHGATIVATALDEVANTHDTKRGEGDGD